MTNPTIRLIGCSLLICVASTAICSADPPKRVYKEVAKLGDMPINGVLTASHFSPDQVHETKEFWSWHRTGGSGGHNYGGDFMVPKDRVLVGWEAHVGSRHRNKGGIDWKLVTEEGRGGILVPKGVHTGARLNPGKLKPGFGGVGGVLESLPKLGDPSKWNGNDLKPLIDSGGATFTGHFVLKYVTFEDWKAKWIAVNW